MAQPAFSAEPVFPYVWTEADLEKLPDDGHRYEILEGSLVMTPPPGGRHQNAGAELLDLLRATSPPGWRALYELGVRIPRGNFVPDIVVLRPGADLDVIWHDPADVALVVEIASPSTETMDRGTKTLKYAEAGIPAYWRIGRDGTLVVYELVDGEYAVIATVLPGESWTAAQPFPVTVAPADLLP